MAVALMLIEGSAVSSGDVGKGNYLEVEAAVVDSGDLSVLELARADDRVHEILIVFSLKGGYESFVQVNGAVDAGEKLAERGEPFRFAMWIRSIDVREKGDSSAKR